MTTTIAILYVSLFSFIGCSIFCVAAARCIKELTCMHRVCELFTKKTQVHIVSSAISKPKQIRTMSVNDIHSVADCTGETPCTILAFLKETNEVSNTDTKININVKHAKTTTFVDKY
jgi:hypothetical protein